MLRRFVPRFFSSSSSSSSSLFQVPSSTLVSSNPVLSRYYDHKSLLFRRFWFELRGDVSGCGFEEALKSVASQHGATGWVMQNPYLHMEGEVFGSLQQCNALETWLSSWKPPMDAHVSELRIPDSRRMLFRQRVFDEFRVEYYL